MKKHLVILCLVILCNVILRIYTANNIDFSLVPSSTLFLPLNYRWLINFVDVISIILLWNLVRHYFSLRIATFSALVYGLSFWSIYYSHVGSVNILIIFFLLVSLFLYRFLSPFKFLRLVPIFTVLIFGLYLNIFLAIDGSIFRSQALINSINTNRGITRLFGFDTVGRLVENKITYIGRVLLFNFVEHFSPVYYFASQQKMLGFSFTPPIFVGFLIPAIFGLKSFFQKVYAKKVLLLGIFLMIIPSVISFNSPSLDKLVLVLPIICVLIGGGLDRLFESKSLISRIVVPITLILILFQGLVVIYDIGSRESERVLKYYNVK